MDKYEYQLKTEHIRQVAARKEYAEAARLCDTIDWTKIRDVKMLTTVSDIYAEVGQYDDAIDVLQQAYQYATMGRRIVYRLTELALKADSYEDAKNYFEEFCRVAPNDQGRYILLYKMARSQKATVEEKIKILEAYKREDFDEKWAYELAVLYAMNEQKDKCVQLCDDIILWFGLGKYVEKALKLKSQFSPLTAAQKEKVEKLAQMKQEEEEEQARAEKAKAREEQARAEKVKAREERARAEKAKAREERARAERAKAREEQARAEKAKAREEQARAEGGSEEQKKYSSYITSDMKTIMAAINRSRREDAGLSEPEVMEPQVPAGECLQEKAASESGWTQAEQREALPETEEGGHEGTAPEGKRIEEEPASEEAADEVDIALAAHDELNQLSDIQCQYTENTTQEEIGTDVVEPVYDSQEYTEAEYVCSPSGETAEAFFSGERTENDSKEYAGEKPEQDGSDEHAGEKPEQDGSDKYTEEEYTESSSDEYAEEEYTESSSDEYAEEEYTESSSDEYAEEEYTESGSDEYAKEEYTEDKDELFESKLPEENPEDLSGVWHFAIQVPLGEDDIELALGYLQELAENSSRPIPGSVVKITGKKLNQKGLIQSLDKLLGKTILVENAGDMNQRVIDEFCKILDPSDRSLLVVFIDTPASIRRLLVTYPQLSRSITAQFIREHFSTTELMDYAKEYADREDSVLDQSGELALMERLEVIAGNQERDKKKIVEIIINNAIEKAEKRSVRKLFKMKYNKDGCLVLRDKDFEVG